MALVPAGRYPVGGAPWREASTVWLGSFYIDSTEVTVGAYRRDLDSTLGGAPRTGRPPQRWPATRVFLGGAGGDFAWRPPRGPPPTPGEGGGPQIGRNPRGRGPPRGRRPQGGSRPTSQGGALSFPPPRPRGPPPGRPPPPAPLDWCPRGPAAPRGGGRSPPRSRYRPAWRS